MRITLKQAKSELKAIGFTITKRNNEYRINHTSGTEATAYYTDDIEDAIATARASVIPAAPAAETIAVPAVLWHDIKFMVDGLAIMETLRNSHPEVHVHFQSLSRRMNEVSK
jgi:hypothetical protein